jgi:hypothetical protein
MAGEDAPPELTELVYVPTQSWSPALVAIGLGAILAGIFMGWFFSLAGAVLVLAGARGWIATSSDFRDRLPRRQEVTSAVIPASPMRRTARRPEPRP